MSCQSETNVNNLLPIVDYVHSYTVDCDLAYQLACDNIIGALARGLLALHDSACTRLLGPVVPGATLAGGARIPGTSYELDPVTAAFNLGVMFYDASHPIAGSMGGILATADYLSRQRANQGKQGLTVREVLAHIVKADRVEHAMVLDGASSRLQAVRAATAAVVSAMFAGTREQIAAAMRNAWDEGASSCEQPLKLRARLLAADATSRGLRHALLVVLNEVSDQSILQESAPMPVSLSVECKVQSDPEMHSLRVQLDFARAVAIHFPARQGENIRRLFADRTQLLAMPMREMLASLVRNS